MTPIVRIVGAGSSVPPLSVTNDRLVRAIPGPNGRPWTAEDIERKTGIVERRFYYDFDEERGLARLHERRELPGPSVRLAEAALREALQSSGLEAPDLDGLIYVSCTPDRLNFQQDTLLLHRRLGMRPDALMLQMDTGCAGGLYALGVAKELLQGSGRRNVAVVGVNVTSPFLNRDVFTGEIDVEGKPLGAFLTMYLFGDGAGALILHRADPVTDDSMSGILASTMSSEYLDLVHRPGGGALLPPGHPLTKLAHMGYYVDGTLVARSFVPRMRASIQDVLAQAGMEIADVSRFCLHQANLRLVEMFADSMGIPRDRAPTHMQRYGNCSAAGVLILFAEEVREGRIVLGSGEPVLLAAIGAGAQAASHLVRV